MTPREKIALLQERFVHRTDTFVHQWYSPEKGRGGYVTAIEGHCPHNCPRRLCEHVSRKPLTEQDILAHLKGEETVGVYQLAENTVKWLCFDVDADTPEGAERITEQTMAVARVVHKLVGPRFLVEQSGRRGYHVWVFFAEPVEGAAALTLGRYVAYQVPPVEGVHIEVYPKQDGSLVRFGNLVKLPLGVHKQTGNRCVFVNNKFEPYPNDEQFTRLHDVNVLTSAELSAIIEDRELTVVPPAATRAENGGIGWTTPPCMARLMDEGTAEGARDTTTFRLACYLRDRGLPEPMATVALDAWNDEKNTPPLDDAQLQSKILSAYSNSYSPFPCGQPEFDAYCSSSCKLWPNKLKSRWTNYGRKEPDAIGTISRD